MTLLPIPQTLAAKAAIGGAGLILLFAGRAPTQAGEIIFDRDPVPGGLVIGTVTPVGQVRLDRKLLRVSPEGWFLMGFGRDDRGEFELVARFDDGTTAIKRFELDRRTYPTERIDGLPEKMLTPGKDDQVRIELENNKIVRLRERDSEATWFTEDFMWPVTGRITGVYGSRRILNGERKRPHYGIDIAAPAGTPVGAAAPGQVIMAETDLYYTGGTVMLDHGHGLTSLYSHLARINVAVDDVVDRGQTIGFVGATGRATGAHLDWRVNLFDSRLDPALLVGPMPEE